jgi:hypothetical protein
MFNVGGVDANGVCVVIVLSVILRRVARASRGKYTG